MSTLIPAITTCKFDTSGERRFARLLEAKLEEDYLCWYNVPVGPRRLHPDFIIMHPRRGILILEVKDWRLSTIKSLNQHEAELLIHGQVVKQKNPLEQAREYATTVVNILQTDSQLIHAEGRYQGKLLFPWACGVVFPLVAIMGSRIVEQAKADADAAKLLYVGMTRATDHLVLTAAG